MNEINPYLANPHEIVQRAIQKNELDKLLLGKPEYCYLPRFTSAPGNTDLPSLLAVLYQCMDKCSQEETCKQLENAIHGIISKYEGIDGIASCLLFEVSRKYRKLPCVNLPLEKITGLFRKTVKTFQDRLVADKTEGGKGRENGRYDDLQRLSRIVVGYGGMAFCEGTEHDPIKPFF